MDDVDENASIVNALQRQASVVVQKSLAEGFGLTVAEAMWKERAVVASRVGGIQDQIVDGVSGFLQRLLLAARGYIAPEMHDTVLHGGVEVQPAHLRNVALVDLVGRPAGVEELVVEDASGKETILGPV